MISVNGGDEMSYRYDMQGKSSQAQAIVRKRDAEDKLRTEEFKKKQDAERIEKAEKLILDFLNEQTEPQSLNDINLATDADGLEVLQALRNLVDKRSISTIDKTEKVSGVNSGHYFIKKDK